MEQVSKHTPTLHFKHSNFVLVCFAVWNSYGVKCNQSGKENETVQDLKKADD